MRNATRLIGLAALAAASVSCGDVVRQGSSPVFLVIDQLAGIRGAAQPGTPAVTLISDVITNVTSPDPCTHGDAVPDDLRRHAARSTLRAPLKDHRRNRVVVADHQQRGDDQPRPRRLRPRRRPQHAGRRRALSASTAR